MPAPEGDLARRITWLMLLRVVVTTLLLGAAIVADAVGPVAREAPLGMFVFGLIGVTYGLTLLWAIALRRGVRPHRLG